MTRPILRIGIDPGTNTGFAIWNPILKAFTEVSTLKIHHALLRIQFLSTTYTVEVYCENPNTWVEFKEQSRKHSDMRRQGAGSIKRDFSIWRDFCKDLGIAFFPVSLHKTMKKLPPEAFVQYTGWFSRTSVHARDAAMLVLNRNN